MFHDSAPIFSNMLFGIFPMQFNSVYVYPIVTKMRQPIAFPLPNLIFRGYSAVCVFSVGDIDHNFQTSPLKGYEGSFPPVRPGQVSATNNFSFSKTYFCAGESSRKEKEKENNPDSSVMRVWAGIEAGAGSGQPRSSECFPAALESWPVSFEHILCGFIF